MVKEPTKKQIQDIVDNLLKSEIPELQAVAKELGDWTKQLEKHGWKLQEYASQLGELVHKQSAQVPAEVSLAELVRDLETTLSELRKQPMESISTSKANEAEETGEAEVAEAGPVAQEAQPRRAVTPRTGRVNRSETGLYRTPEGFLVRRRRA